MPAGRPRKFNSPEEMQALMDAYFDKCEDEERGEPPTVTGLCLALDIDKATLLNYEKREEFLYTVKKAKLRIEKYLELSLFRTAQVAGIIFNLKENFGWKDKSEVDMKHGIKDMDDGKITIEFVSADENQGSDEISPPAEA